MEREADRRRLRSSLLISIAFWAVLMPLLALLNFEGPLPPPESMNPIYVELAPVEDPPRQERPRPAAAAPADADRTDPAPAGAASVQETVAASGGAEAAAPTPALRADPSAAPLPASRTRSAAPFQGGSDALAPLSEEALAGEAPIPASRTEAPAARTAKAKPAGDGGGTDEFGKKLLDTAERLASGAPSGTASGAAAGGRVRTDAAASGSGTGSGSATGSGAGTRGAGDLSGGLDFGGGATRELWSPRRIKVPDKLLAGKPNDLVTRVSFIVEAGGTVLADTIRFDPPFPRDLDAFLRAAFSSWIFSPADSDGQVVFRYSIKVR